MGPLYQFWGGGGISLMILTYSSRKGDQQRGIKFLRFLGQVQVLTTPEGNKGSIYESQRQTFRSGISITQAHSTTSASARSENKQSQVK